MKTWLRVILLILALLLCAIVAGALVGTWMYHGQPKWYHVSHLTSEQHKAAANSADQKLADVFSWVASVHAQNVRRQLGTSGPAGTVDAPENSKTVTLNEEEINSFIQTWNSPEKAQLQRMLAKFFSDGRLVLVDGGIIVAGQSNDFGTLASAQFNPMIDANGKLSLQFQGIQAGRLPVPDSMVAGKMDRLKGYLQDRVALRQQSAMYDSALTANASAMATVMTRLLLDGLNGKASQPILMLPFDLHDFHQSMPVKLTGIKLSEGEMTLTLQPLSTIDRPALNQLIEQPYQP